VALKVLAVGPGGSSPERLGFGRFLREAEASSRLDHPHIVRLLDRDERAGLLVLEHMPGGTLAALLGREGRLDPARARRIGLELLSALAAAHHAGIVHRDVKPANVFFDGAGNAKLADFGAAHLVDFGNTQTGGFIGTLAYLSPEQISGAPIDLRADLYALGVTLFEALIGRLPFLGPDIVGQHLGETPPVPSSLLPALVAAHDQVLLRALAKAPGDRFASAEEMAEAIAAWPQDPRPGARPAGPAEPAIASAASATPAPREELGRTERGRLYATTDPRVGRPVLVEELDRPLDEVGRERLRVLAAAGGPRVQRVLALHEGAGASTIVYEALAGEVLPLAALDGAERGALAPVWPALAGAGLDAGPERRVVRTDAGPVILVVAPAGGV
jgi:serine/threonine-protein kinase